MSKSFAVDKSDLLAVAKNALLVGVAAVLTYIGENISSVDLGSATALVVPVVVVAINTMVKWVKDNTAKK
jgi:hypothetical protein